VEAGYACAPHKARGHGHRLRTREDVAARIREILSQQRMIEERATERAIERLALSKEAVARELASMGFAKTGLVGPDGRMDFSKEVSVPTGLLQAKRQSLMDIAKLFGWISEREEVTPLEQRLRAMTPDQREEYAREFYRKVQQRLLEADATGEDEGRIGRVIDQEPERNERRR
jgi:hypothetical protein